MLKKILSVMLVFLLLFGVCACQQTPATPDSSAADSTAEESSVMSSQEAEVSLDETSSLPEESSAPSSMAEPPTNRPSKPTESPADTAHEPAESVVASEETSSLQEPVDTEESSEPEPSSVVSSKAPPVDWCNSYDFSEKTAEQLIAWINQLKNKPITQRPEFVTDILYNGKMVIPKPANDQLEMYQVQIWINVESCDFYFRSKEAGSSSTIYRLYIGRDPYNGADLMSPERHPVQRDWKRGNYNGFDFIYLDGLKSDEPMTRQVTQAQFLMDGCLIKVTRHDENCYGPWNNDFFDDIIYETVTF